MNQLYLGITGELDCVHRIFKCSNVPSMVKTKPCNLRSYRGLCYLKYWGALQDVFRNPTNEFKEEILTFNTFLKALKIEECT